MGLVEGAGRIRLFCGAIGLASLGVMALLLPGYASADTPPTLWTKCVGGSNDLPCGIVRGVAADRNPPGHVYVLDQGGTRVLEFTSRGEFVKTWGWDVVETGPGDDTVSPEDEFEVCVPGSGDVCKPGLSGIAGIGQFSGPLGAAIDSAGDVYIADFTARRVQKFNPDGEFIVMWGGEVNKTKTEAAAPEPQRNRCPVDPGDVCQAGTFGTGNGQFGNWGIGDVITIDASDKVYVGDEGRIQRFNTNGEYTGQIPVGVKRVRGLAADSVGNLLAIYHAEFGSEPYVDKLSPIGFPLCQASVTNPTAVASDVTDPSGRFHAFEASENRIVTFDSLCANEGLDFPVEGVTGSTGLDAGSACIGDEALLSFGPNLYVTNPSSTSGLARAYGQPPNSNICLPPPKSPIVVDQYVLSVDTDGATVGAEIDPRGWADARYYVQYATAACVATGDWTAACVKEQPVPPGSLLGGEGLLAEATILLHGLEPDTAYSFRFVVESGFGLEDTNGPVFGMDPDGEGPEEAIIEKGVVATFTTFPQPSTAKTGCPNQAFRVDRAAFLPDCRAYEMVSPVDKANGDIATPSDPNNWGGDVAFEQAAQTVPEGGRGLTYSSQQAFGDVQSAVSVNQYLATRAPDDGWSSQPLFPPREGASFFGLGAKTFFLNFKAFSPDLRYGWLLHDAEPPLDGCAPAGFVNFYRRDNAAGTYRVLSCEEIADLFSVEFQGISTDSTHALFRSRDQLTEDALPSSSGAFQLYEWEESLGGGELRLVSVLPDSSTCPGASSAGTDNGDRNDGRSHLVTGAISADGKRIYWSCNQKLYLRSGGSGPSAEVSIGPAQFWGAAGDGSTALFTEGNFFKGEGTLYRFNAASGEVGNPIADRIKGIFGASADASRVYLVSEADLDGAGAGQADEPNLYLYDADADSFTFIAVLSEDDASTASSHGTLSPLSHQPIVHSSRVSPDGRHAAFMSNSPELAELVAGFDNTDAVSGEPDTEVYLYQADSNQLHCVSCNRSGARPRGRDIEPYGPPPDEFWVSARIPGWVYFLHAQRVLSDDGSHLFFESFNALVPRDTNGKQDVYEWQPANDEQDCKDAGAELFVSNTAGAGGCLSLISSGESAEDSDFADASADGRDVFFKTHESLLPQDPGLRDIYDARVLGGFPPPDPIDTICEGEACQSPPAPPIPPTPASKALDGPGNHPDKARKRCRKGKRKVVRKGKARCVKKHRKRKGQRKRRAGR